MAKSLNVLHHALPFTQTIYVREEFNLFCRVISDNSSCSPALASEPFRAERTFCIQMMLHADQLAFLPDSPEIDKPKAAVDITSGGYPQPRDIHFVV
eukprot:scaffold82583_cov17-Prasinocladus_malaysianus.AAC.1